MDSILAPTVDGTYQRVFGQQIKGLFLQRLESGRFLFRHAGSGLSLFYFLGTPRQATDLLQHLVERFDFQRDSVWVLKNQSEIHFLLRSFPLGRRWLFRAWHYEASTQAD